MKSWTATLIVLGAVCAGILSKPAEGQLRWPGPPKRAPMRVRLVAEALALPRSSFFSSHEVFVAETEIGNDEWRLIKLVFNFLPYQPGLMDTGFDYSVVHELSAWRDPDCDETVEHLTSRSLPKRQQPLMYSKNVPREDLDRRNIPLPCYDTNADEYIRSSLEPIAPPPEVRPFLQQRSQLKPIPFFDGQPKPEPIPFLGDRSAPKPIPFLGDRSRPKPLEERSKAKPIPFMEEPLKPIPFLEDPATRR